MLTPFSAPGGSREATISMRARATVLDLVSAAAVLAATHVYAQEPALSAEDVATSVAAQIEDLQSSQGINSPALIDLLTNLGLIFREQGDADLAVAAFERARHIVRVNYGLSSFQEAPLVRQLVQIEEAKGNVAAAWDLEQELIDMIYQRPGPRPVAASMLREIADKRLDVLERYTAGKDFPPQIELGCYYSGPPRSNAAIEPEPRSCRSGTSSSVKQALYEEATGYYYDVMDMIRFSEGPSSDELPELYMAVLRASYAARNDLTEYQGNGMLRRVYAHHVRYSAPLPVQMNALLQMADWDLLYASGRKQNEAAFQAYEALHDRLVQKGLEPSFIDEIFSPRVPIVLPTFAPSRLVFGEAPGSLGYLDVAFEITKYGEGKSVEILDTSTNKTEAARRQIRDLIQWARFRPRMANGAFEDPSRVVVRYYVNE